MPHPSLHLPALILALAVASPAEAAILCASSCTFDPSTPPPPGVDWDIVRVISLDPGEDLSLGVTGSAYVFAPGGLFSGESLTLLGHTITLVSSGSLSLVADTVVLGQGAPDGSEAMQIVGDVYVAIAVPLGDFHLAATGTIFASDEALAFVPEPSPLALVAGILAVRACRTRWQGIPRT